MKKIFLTTIAASLFLNVFATNPEKCGFVSHLNYLEQQDPNYEQQLKDNEQKIDALVNQAGYLRATNAVSTIPVVVHIVYQNNSQNLTDAQVESQIVVLNEDFARRNADTTNTPLPFRSLASGTNYQFCLARRTPEGGPTNGIERRQTTVSSFSTSDNMKSFSQGGLDAWDVSEYMNIWVCKLGGLILGYAEPPGPHSNTFGIVISYDSFGRLGSAVSPYNLGRTSTHEMGHCFGMYHTWGDDNGACSGSDYIADTPNQAEETYGCHTFPFTDACSTTSPGIMYMNYMDYSDDNCLNMFTVGQTSRMSASINNYYPTLLNSIGCSEPTGISETASGFNFSVYPSPTTGIINVDMFSTRNLGNDVKIFVTNSLGQNVKTEKINTSASYLHQIDLSNQVSGVYFVTVSSDNFTRTERIIVGM